MRGPRRPRPAPRSVDEHFNLLGGQAQPHPSAPSSALGAEWLHAQAEQQNALPYQLWGSQKLMRLNGLALALANQETFVQLGPWREPRTIALDRAGPKGSGASAGSQAAERVYRLKYTLTVGVGSASYNYDTYELPRLVTCSSLVVQAQRVDTGIDDTPIVVNLWAAPHVERSWPMPLLTRHYAMAIGVNVVTLDRPPIGATHMMVSCGLGNYSMEFLVTFVEPEGFTAQPQQKYPVVQNITSGWVVPMLWPIPRDQLFSMDLRRSSTAAADTFAVTWLRA